VTRDDRGRFVKGETGNPSGRKPKEQERAYYDVTMSTVSLDDWRAIVQRAANDAKRGDASARKWLGDYLVGQPVQKTEVSGPDGGPVEIKKTYVTISPDDWDAITNAIQPATVAD
jgi:hypothetical protein